MRRLTVNLIVLMMVLISASTIVAQSRPPLRLSLQPTYDFIRSQAPVMLTATMTPAKGSLIEGRLELEYYIGRRLSGTYVTDELALVDAPLSIPIMLPPQTIPTEQTLFTIQASFITDDATYDLDEHDVVVPTWQQRVFIVGICHPIDQVQTISHVQTGGSESSDLARSLRLDRLIDTGGDLKTFVTGTHYLEPSDVPRQPMRLMGLDIVFITREGFDALQASQLEALIEWVDAGGSLAVLAVGPNQPQQEKFLNRLAESAPLDPAFIFDAEGAIISAPKTTDGIHRFSPGVGRGMVVTDTIDVDSPQWREAVLFLWRVRASRLAELARVRPNADEGRQVSTVNRSVGRYRWLSIEPPARVMKLLLPDSIEGVPFLLVCTILVLFLLAIAPGDYFFLGLIRKRRWTWVTFPLLSLLFTYATVRLANAAMGHRDYSRSIVFADLGTDGTMVRTSRFRMAFTASNQLEAHELSNTLLVDMDAVDLSRDLDPGMYSSVMYEEQPYDSYQPSFDDVDEPINWVGQPPSRYVAQQQQRQWVPRLTRQTTFGADDDVETRVASAPVWNQTVWQDFEDEKTTAAALEQFARAFPGANVIIMHNEEITERTVAADLPEITLESNPVVEVNGGEGAATFEGVVKKTSTPLLHVQNLVTQVSRRPVQLLYRLLSQVSPSGRGCFEDLTLLDETDDQQALVIVITHDGEGNYTAFRRLYDQYDRPPIAEGTD